MPFHSSVRFKKTFYKGKHSAFPNLFYLFIFNIFDPFPRLLHHLSHAAQAEECPAHEAAVGLPRKAPSRSPAAAQPEPGALRTPRGRRPRSRSRSSPVPAPPRRLLPRRCRLRAPLALEAVHGPAPLLLSVTSLRAPARGWRRSDRWVPNAGRICAHPAPVTLAEQRGTRSWPPSAAFFYPPDPHRLADVARLALLRLPRVFCKGSPPCHLQLCWDAALWNVSEALPFSLYVGNSE